MPVKEKERLMRLALSQARKAGAAGEVPVGAVIVRDGLILGRGYNLRQPRQDVTLHAEMIALRQACRRLGSRRLPDCDIYVTLEPCLMCAGAIIQARLRSLYFAAPDPKTGACGSFTDVFSLKHNHFVTVVPGLLASECRLLRHD